MGSLDKASSIDARYATWIPAKRYALSGMTGLKARESANFRHPGRRPGIQGGLVYNMRFSNVTEHQVHRYVWNRRTLS